MAALAALPSKGISNAERISNTDQLQLKPQIRTFDNLSIDPGGRSPSVIRRRTCVCLLSHFIESASCSQEYRDRRHSAINIVWQSGWPIPIPIIPPWI